MAPRESSSIDEQGCSWPDCPSRFPVDSEPATSGWWAFGIGSRKIVLCPFHSSGDHRPEVVRLTPYETPLRPSCSCGWAGGIQRSMNQVEFTWRQHVRSCEGV